MLRVYTSEQNNEQVGPHFKVKEFACKDGSAITFIDDYMVTILELLRKELDNKPIIFPAYAGVIPWGWYVPIWGPSFPRIRGGDPVSRPG